MSSAHPPKNLVLGADGWLIDNRLDIDSRFDIDKCESPNFSSRPENCDVSLLILHNISLPPGKFGAECIKKFFCNRLDLSEHVYFESLKGVEVSAHFLIDRRGGLVQFVSVLDRAWHAGKSEFDGQDDCNNFSVGIEMEGTDFVPYTDAQYQSVGRLAKALTNFYPSITIDRIVGHSDVAPVRKSDPGPSFDWAKLRHILSDDGITKK